MRAGFGLLSILVVATIIFWVSFGPTGNGTHGYVNQVLKSGKEGRDQASQISGHDADGVPVSESIKTEELDVGGHFRRIKVVSLVPGGAFETAFKLRPGDEVSEIGGLPVDMNNDYGLAQAQLYESIARNQPLTVVRGGQKVTLTPDAALTQMHPNLFGAPGATAVPTH